MRRGKIWTIGGIAIFIGGVFLLNHQSRANPEARLLLLSHRGLSQTFPHEGVTNDTCTAEIIHSPTHPYLENTIASMREAFRLGADIVEIDVHPTTDGQFAVFHDYTIECRTEGQGATRDHAMTYLKTLDIGYGYTSDGGKTFPFRGKGIGLMPTLNEVIATFPGKRFLINVKSNEAREGELLADWLLRQTPEQRRLLEAYGGGINPFTVLRRRVPDMRVSDKTVLKSCLLPYMALGWSGYVPAGCRNTVFPIPLNYTWLVWGWPHRLSARMEKMNTAIWLIGPYNGGAMEGVDTAEQFARVPRGFAGEVLTNEIGLIGPLAKARQRRIIRP